MDQQHDVLDANGMLIQELDSTMAPNGSLDVLQIETHFFFNIGQHIYKLISLKQQKNVIIQNKLKFESKFKKKFIYVCYGYWVGPRVEKITSVNMNFSLVLTQI